METIQTLSLIKGKYTPIEAKEILTEVLKAKINFHNLKNFSSEIRNNKSDEQSKRRIIELSEAKEYMLDLIKVAQISEKNISIESDIFIQVVD